MVLGCVATGKRLFCNYLLADDDGGFMMMTTTCVCGLSNLWILKWGAWNLFFIIDFLIFLPLLKTKNQMFLYIETVIKIN